MSLAHGGDVVGMKQREQRQVPVLSKRPAIALSYYRLGNRKVSHLCTPMTIPIVPRFERVKQTHVQTFERSDEALTRPLSDEFDDKSRHR
jgi:hypothetical protein